MTTLNISSTTPGSAGLVVETWERGSGAQPDTCIETRVLGPGDHAAGLAVGGTRYLVVRDAMADAAKTIDNWSQTPPAPGDA